MNSPHPIIRGPYLEDLLRQPDAVRDTLAALPPHAVAGFAREIADATPGQLILTGMGTSLFALYPLQTCLAARGRSAVVIETSELVYAQPGLLAPGRVVLVVSQSGASAETVRLIERLPQGFRLLGVTNTPGSPLAEASAMHLLTHAGTEACVSCKTYVATLAAIRLVGAAVDGSDVGSAHQALAAGADAMAAWLADWESHVETWCAWLAGVQNLFVTGRGDSLAAAHTAGLIIKESAHFPAEGLSSAAFRHGPFEMVRPESLVAVLEGALGMDVLNRQLVVDVRWAGGRAELIGPSAEAAAARLPALTSPAMPLVEVLPLQMIALALAALGGREAGRFERATKVTTVG
jgi:glucosamine--fructose-6-phosphate aminotransferase (isomerizing)